MKKIEKLDAIRGFVAVYVMFHHIFFSINYQVGDYNVYRIFGYGKAAVMVFFILSGFVIHYSHDRAKDKSFKLFFFKRFFRIYIPLICVFICNYLIFLIEGKSVNYDSLIDLAGNLLMLQDAPLIIPDRIDFRSFLGNSPLWSLTFEWWFYMFYFFLYKYKKKYATTIVYLFGIIAVFSIVYPVFINRFFVYLLLWWTGVVLAEVYNSEKKIGFITMIKPLSVILICAIILNIFLQTNLGNVYRGSIVSLYDSMKHGLIIISGGLVWHYFKWRFFDQTIGLFKYFTNISYGIYISHWFLVAYADYLYFIQNHLLRYSLYIIICLLFSYLIERVIYVRLNKYLMRRIFN